MTDEDSKAIRESLKRIEMLLQTMVSIQTIEFEIVAEKVPQRHPINKRLQSVREHTFQNWPQWMRS